jgi:uncharacterized membrane protein
MRKVYLFLAVLTASLVSLTVLVAVGMAVLGAGQQTPSSWWNGMWGGMMGNGMMGGNSQPVVQNPAVPYFGVAFVVLVGLAVVGVVGLAYYVAVPEIRAGAAPVVCETVPKENALVQEQKQEAACTPLESVVKTLSGDERKVVDVLAAHDGKYLQKYIRNEAGLSRLQTHRVVARLAERGIVTLEKTGNTNQVLLAEWLKK